MKSLPRLRLILLPIALSLAVAPATFAQAKNYSRGTVNVTSANWARTTVNGVINSISGSAVVTITATNGVTVNTLSGGTLNVGAASGNAVATTVGSLAGGRVSVNTSGNLSVSAIASPIKTLTVKGAISLPGALTVSGAVTLNGGTITGGALSAARYNVRSGTIDADLLGTGGLTKTTGGTVTLTGTANAYSGTTTVTAGTLTIGSGSGLPSGALTVNGGNLDLGGSTATVGAVKVSRGSISNGTVSSSASYSVTGGTINANLSGTAALTKTGAGKAILNGINDYEGLTTVSAGTLEVSAASLPGDVLNNAVLTFNESSSATYASVIRGRGRLIMSGSGTLTLSGVNTFTGNTTVSAGTLALNASSLNGAIVNRGTVSFTQSDLSAAANFGGAISGTGAVVKDGAGALILSGANTYTGGTTVNAGALAGSTRSLQGSIVNNGSLVFDTSAISGTHRGVISGSGDLTKSGSGTLTLAGANTYTGGTTVSAGTLAGTATSLQGDISNEGVILFNQATAGTYAGNISGTNGSVIKAGGGTLTFTGTNTYAGGTTVSAGTLQGNVANLQGNIVNNATVAFDQATDGVYSDIISGSGRVVKTGNGKLTLSGDNIYRGGTTVSAGILSGTVVSLQGRIVNNAHVEFTESSQGTYEGNMSGLGTLTKLGAGTLTLSGANTYRGGTTVTAGTLAGSTRSLQGNIANNATVEFEQVTSGTYAGAMSGSGVLLKRGTGVLTLSGANTYTGGTTVFAGTLAGNATSLQGDITNDAAVTFNQAGTGTYAGVMSGTGSLTKAGGGTLVLSGANSYTGGTTVTSGTLEGDTTSLQGQIGNNATVAFNESGSGTYSDLMFGSGQLRKIGAGTLTLSGANSYRGATTVSTGALYVEGNQASATGSVTVDQGATLGGKGTIGGATTINGNHLIGQSAADDAAGIQSFSRSLTYRPGAQAFWRLTDNTTDIGTEGNYTYDRAVVGTSLVASNAQSFTFSMAFNANGSTVDWSNAFWDQEYTGTAGWLVYDATSLSITGTLAPTSDLLDSQGVELSTVRPDYSFVFYRDNAEGNVYLNYIYSP